MKTPLSCRLANAVNHEGFASGGWCNCEPCNKLSAALSRAMKKVGGLTPDPLKVSCLECSEMMGGTGDAGQSGDVGRPCIGADGGPSDMIHLSRLRVALASMVE